MSIEKLIAENTAALKENTAALLASGGSAAPKTAAKTTEKKAAPKKAAPKKAAPKKPSAAERKAAFLKTVGDGIKGQDSKEKAEAVKKTALELAEYYGASRPSELKAQDYDEYLEGFAQIMEGEVPDVINSNMEEEEEEELDDI